MANNNAFIDVRIGTASAEKDLNKVVNALTKMGNVSEQQSKKLKESFASVFNEPVPTKQYEELEKEFDLLANKMDVLRHKQERFLATGGKEKSSAYKKMEYDMRTLMNQQDALSVKMANMENSGMAFEHTAQAINHEGTEANKTASAVSRLDSAQKKSNSTHKRGVKIFSSLGNAIKKQKSSLAGGFKTVLKYAFGIRSLFVLFNRLCNAMVEGFKNLAQFNNGLNPTNTALSNLMSAFTRLKNSVATAFAPLLTVVEPILTRLIDKVSDFANAVGMAFAKISGQKTFTKAIKVQQNYAKSLDGTKKSANDTEKALAGYDKLEVISKDKDSGNEESQVVPNDMFQVEEVSKEETQIEGVIKKLLSVVQPIGKQLQTTFGLVVSAISQIAPPLLDIVSAIIPPLLDMLNAFIPVLTNIIMGLMPFFLSIVQQIMPVITEIVMALLPVLQSVFTALTPLFDVIVNTILPFLLQIIKQLLPPIMTVLDLITSLIEPLLSLITPLIEIMVSVLQPIIELIVGVVSILIEALAPAVKLIVSIISSVFAPILKVLANIISTVCGWFSKVIKIIIDGVIVAIKKLEPVINAIIIVFKFLGDIVHKIFNGIWTIIKTIINGIISGVEGLANAVIKAVNFIIKAINKISFDVPDWVPVIGGKKFGFNLKEVSEVKIPRLAQGGVIPPNSEFMAILGDQKRGTNIETPLDTMIQAFKTALAESGGGMPSEIKVVLPNGKVLAETVWDEEAKYYKQTGYYRPDMA